MRAFFGSVDLESAAALAALWVITLSYAGGEPADRSPPDADPAVVAPDEDERTGGCVR